MSRFVRRCAPKILAGIFSGLMLQAVLPSLAAAQPSEIEQLRRELMEQRKYIQSLEKRLDAQTQILFRRNARGRKRIQSMIVKLGGQ
jgi:hypothetical protein